MSKRKMKDSGVEWLGEIPAEWGVSSLSQQACQVKCKNDNLVEKNLLSLSYGKIKRRDIDAVGGLLPASFEGYNRVESGDIVLRLTDLQNDQHSLRTGLVKERGIVTSAYVSVRPSSRSSSEYLHLALYAFDVVKGFYGMGSGVRQGLTYGDVKQLRLPAPPLSTQRKIAEYLDARCAKIDEMISDAKKTIEEYKAWKASVIFEAVTGKCKIENGECKIGGWAMRESGVEWIGMIPEGWRVNRVKRIVRVENGSDPLTEGSIPVYGSGESSFKTCGEFKEGPTVLLGRKGATLHIPHYIEGRYWNVDTAFDVRMKGNDNLRWFYYLAISFDYKAYISKTTLPSMTQSNYNNMHVPHPPVTEQCAIAAFLDKKCAAIDRVISAKESLIADLEAYKKSLIFECVTGKMEVA